MIIRLIKWATRRAAKTRVMMAEVVQVTTTVIDKGYDYAHVEDVLWVKFRDRLYLVTTKNVGAYAPGMPVKVRQTHPNPIYPIQLVS